MKKLLLISIVFFLGFYISLNYTSKEIEEFTLGSKSYECPDIIIKKGNKIYLKKSNKAIVPGINPIVFNNLNEYVEFMHWQRSQNINCPVLYLEESYNAQGHKTYKMRPNMFYPQGGLNTYNPEEETLPSTGPKYEESLLIVAARNDPPYNKNSYPGFDPQNQYVGLEVPIDKLFHQQETSVKSDNPMDRNWGGVEYSQQSVGSGKYSDENVQIYVD